MGREVKPYQFMGEEGTVVDGERYERALRSWAEYLVRHTTGERPRNQPRRADEKS